MLCPDLCPKGELGIAMQQGAIELESSLPVGVQDDLQRKILILIPLAEKSVIAATLTTLSYWPQSGGTDAMIWRRCFWLYFLHSEVHATRSAETISTLMANSPPDYFPHVFWINRRMTGCQIARLISS
jgi:hypothetical protein